MRLDDFRASAQLSSLTKFSLRIPHQIFEGQGILLLLMFVLILKINGTKFLFRKRYANSQKKNLGKVLTFHPIFTEYLPLATLKRNSNPSSY